MPPYSVSPGNKGTPTARRPFSLGSTPGSARLAASHRPLGIHVKEPTPDESAVCALCKCPQRIDVTVASVPLTTSGNSDCYTEAVVPFEQARSSSNDMSSTEEPETSDSVTRQAMAEATTHHHATGLMWLTHIRTVLASVASILLIVCSID